MKTKFEYFFILGFSKKENPSCDDIKERVKELSFNHHPDRGGNEEVFKEIQEAKAALLEGKYEEDKEDLALAPIVAENIMSFLQKASEEVIVEKNNYKIKLIGKTITRIQTEVDDDRIITFGGQILKIRGQG